MSRKTVFKLICVGVPTLLLVASGEVHYRWISPKDAVYWTVADFESTAPGKKMPVTFDRELGFRPEFDGRNYSVYGTRVNAYPIERRRGIQRVLFVGDSVTARGKLIDALSTAYGRSDIEYWNAGVEAFDPTQEWRYYERYNYQVQPDQVVLTLHNNDFTTQTVVDFDDDGYITFYSADPPRSIWLPWPLRHSAFVRAKLHRWNLKDREHSAPARVETALRAMRDRLAADGIAFSVVVMPLLNQLRDWSPEEVAARNQALAICDRLGLRTFDPLPALEQALGAGVVACETPGDTWHPSAAVCTPLARSLRAQGLLDTRRPVTAGAGLAERRDTSRR